MSEKWHGVFPAVTTKFTDNDRLDISSMESHFNFQIEAGVHGLIVTGSLGECSTLDQDEKIEVLKTAVRVSSGRVPVLMGVAENSTRAACMMTERGAEAGADGFMILPAMLYPADRRETLAHFFAVADATPKPLMVYNNPVSYKVDTTPEMFVELASHPAFVAIKESSDNVRRITDLVNLTGDRYQIFTGVDNLGLESLLMGAVGWVAGLVDAFPRETVVVYELARAGRIEEALKVYRWFKPLLDLDVSTKLVQNIKLTEQIVGVGTERVRAPRLILSGDERARVIRVVENALERRSEIAEIIENHT